MIWQLTASTPNNSLKLRCKICGEEYVGEALRALNVTTKEHQDAVHLEKTEKSAIVQHVHDQKQPHQIN